MKKLAFRFGQILCLFTFVLMLLHYSLLLKYAKEGLLVWASCVLPLLLPFIILSKFWIRYKIPELFFRQVQKLFPANDSIAVSLPLFLLGLCSGFPIGAVFISHYYQNKLLNKRLAQLLLPLASFVSPMFVIGYVCSQMHLEGSLRFRYIFSLYLPVILSYLFILLLENTNKKIPATHKNLRLHPDNTTASKVSLTESVFIPSLEIIFVIGIYMMIFSVLSGTLMKLPLFQTPALTFLLANLEITTGIHLLAAKDVYTPEIMYALTAAASSFGGMCTMAQVQTVISHTDLSLKPYIVIKLLTSAATFLLCIFLFN